MLNKIFFWLSKYIKYPLTIKQLSNRLKYQFLNKGEILYYRPLWVTIYASDKCNLRCKMCPHHTLGDVSDFDFLKKNEGIMDIKMFKEVLNKFPESYLFMFAGVGEPLVNPNLFDLFDLAAQNNKMINLVTNGTLLNDEKIKKIITNGKFNQISISLNASNPDEYVKITNTSADNFYKVIKNIKKLVTFKKKYKANLEIIVSAVCSQEFLGNVYDFIKLVDKFSVDRIDIHNYIDFSIQETNSKWSCINTNIETKGFLDKINNYCKNNIKTKVNLPILFQKENFIVSCDWFLKHISIDAQGNVGSCGRVMSPQKKYGNIIDNEDVWNNGYFRSVRLRFLSGEKDLLNPCKSCVENFKHN